MEHELLHKQLQRLSPSDLVNEKPQELRIYPKSGETDSKNINLYYAPFDFVNKNAKLVFIGITPGDSQMRRAWNAGQNALLNGKELSSVISEVKRVSSFNDKKGQMRPNLFKQIEHWGVHDWLGLASGESFFKEGWNLIQTTSLLRYPTFKGNDNYDGKSPTILSHPYLSSIIDKILVPELNSIPDALLFPLGPKVESIIKTLYLEKRIVNPCAFGMLHPSPQNTYRLNFLTSNRKGKEPYRTNIKSYDSGRAEFRERFIQ